MNATYWMRVITIQAIHFICYLLIVRSYCIFGLQLKYDTVLNIWGFIHLNSVFIVSYFVIELKNKMHGVDMNHNNTESPETTFLNSIWEKSYFFNRHSFIYSKFYWTETERNQKFLQYFVTINGIDGTNRSIFVFVNAQSLRLRDIISCPLLSNCSHFHLDHIHQPILDWDYFWWILWDIALYAVVEI